jgi:hypothetical protein
LELAFPQGGSSSSFGQVNQLTSIVYALDLVQPFCCSCMRDSVEEVSVLGKHVLTACLQLTGLNFNPNSTVLCECSRMPLAMQ